MALNGYAHVISHSFLESTRKYYERKDETASNGLLSSLASMVGHMFLADEDSLDNNDLEPNDAVLMAFYEIVHLNRNFITHLTHTQSEHFDNGIADLSSTGQNQKTEELRSLPSNLLVTFFEFCSIVMLQTKSKLTLY